MPNQNKIRNIKELFDNYWEHIKPDDFSEVQFTETRKAFYCGIYSFLSEQLNTAIPSMTDDEILNWVRSCFNETRVLILKDIQSYLEERN